MVDTFPTLPGIAWPVARSLAGLSARQEAISGKRTILPMRTIPRWSWELSFSGDGFLRNRLFGDGSYPELETLSAFCLAHIMTGLAFGYTDASDNTATLQGFGAGDGTTTQFQLVRARGGWSEPVYLPTITSMTVGGVAVHSPADYTVGETGIVTFTAAPAPAAALVWNGTFNWLCRFDDDSVAFTDFMAGLSDLKSLKFSSEIIP